MQCSYCIRDHSQIAKGKAATPVEVMEAIWVASETRAGAAYAHSALALDALGELDDLPGHAVSEAV